MMGIFFFFFFFYVEARKRDLLDDIFIVFVFFFSRNSKEIFENENLSFNFDIEKRSLSRFFF